MSRLFGSVRQNGYVVRDIEAAMRFWSDVLGVGLWFYALTHRWMAYAPDRPRHANVERWYQRLTERDAFAEHVMSVTPGR